jgi:hypothetical protein
MVVQPTTESVDLAAAVEYDKERQTIEKCLSKLSPPIVRTKSSKKKTISIRCFSIDSRY